jgi:hypothetical protein
LRKPPEAAFSLTRHEERFEPLSHGLDCGVFDTNGWLDSLASAGVSIGWSARLAVSCGRSTFRTGVDEEKLKAGFKEVLFVHLPKTEKAKSKAIEVKVE